MKVLYISDPERTDYRDMTYAPDEWMLANSTPFVEKKWADAWKQCHESDKIIIAKMHHELLIRGVNFNFDEALKEHPATED